MMIFTKATDSGKVYGLIFVPKIVSSLAKISSGHIFIAFFIGAQPKTSTVAPVLEGTSKEFRGLNFVDIQGTYLVLNQLHSKVRGDFKQDKNSRLNFFFGTLE